MPTWDERGASAEGTVRRCIPNQHMEAVKGPRQIKKQPFNFNAAEMTDEKTFVVVKESRNVNDNQAPLST